jgi:hypothetical protein
MQARITPTRTFLKYDINHEFVENMAVEFGNLAPIETYDDEIVCGFEVEFYLNKDAPSAAMDRMLKCGLNAFAEKVILLPYGLEENKERDVWYIERDPTLEESDFGFELVSPVLSLSKIPFYLDAVLSVIRDIGYTSESCGLHIHISSPKLQSVDKVKLLLLMEHTGALKDWSSRSFYAKDIVGVFKNTDIDCFLKGEPGLSKNYSINFISDNHIEIRCFGGENYEKNFNKIINDFYNFLSVYHSACNPTSSTRLYENLLESKNNKKHLNMPSSDEVFGLALEIMEGIGHSLDDSLEIALSLFEENRMVSREEIEKDARATKI